MVRLRKDEKPWQKKKQAHLDSLWQASSPSLPKRYALVILPHLVRPGDDGGEAHAGDAPSELARSAPGLF